MKGDIELLKTADALRAENARIRRDLERERFANTLLTRFLSAALEALHGGVLLRKDAPTERLSYGETIDGGIFAYLDDEK